eukprot:1836331-Pyramimonas_sp.AAC.1
MENVAPAHTTATKNTAPRALAIPSGCIPRVEYCLYQTNENKSRNSLTGPHYPRETHLHFSIRKVKYPLQDSRSNHLGNGSRKRPPETRSGEPWPEFSRGAPRDAAGGSVLFPHIGKNRLAEQLGVGIGEE